MLNRTSKLFLQSIFGPRAADATVEWWKFDQKTGKAVGRQTARAQEAKPAADDAVYWSVGFMKSGTSRSNANTEAVHALVADDVGTKVPRDLVDLFMPVPTAVVETSSGNFQYVWAVPRGMTVGQHRQLWAGMEAVLGVRMDGSDQSHLFRLPEGVNGKPGKAFAVKGLTLSSWASYEFSELIALLPSPAAGAPGLRGSASSSGGQTATVEQVRRALKVLPNDGTSVWCSDRKSWIDMGMAIKGALGDAGFPVWEEWCSQQPQGEDPLDVWEGLNPHSIGWGFIEILAKTHGGGSLAAQAFDDGDPGLEGAVADHNARGKRTLVDFWYHAESGKFIDVRTKKLWPGVSVDAEVPSSGQVDKAGKPVPASRVIKQRWIAHQLSWIPGRGQVIPNTEVKSGGVMGSPGNTIFNLYEGPWPVEGDPQKSFPWVAHVRKLYPEEAEHILDWFAHRVQFPGVKINHALVIGGGQGCGKDTMIEPLVRAVGSWNFGDVKPMDLMARFNLYRKSVVLRVNEIYDLGEGLNRVKFYSMMKTLVAAPPEALDVEQKGIDVYYIPNVVGVIMTTNHKLDGLYLPDDDRRHYVAWSKLTLSDFKDGYFRDLWAWMERDGYAHVRAFLAARDLSKFDPKAPPVKTRAFRAIAAVSRGGSNDKVEDVIAALGNPDVFSWEDFLNKAPGDLHDMAKTNSRRLAGCIEQEGYEKIDNPKSKSGRWSIGNIAKVTLYGKRRLTSREQVAAADRWVQKKVADGLKFNA